MDGDSGVHFILLQVLVHAPGKSVLIANVIIFFLVSVSAIMAASEIAFFSLSNVEVAGLRASTDKANNRVAALLSQPRYLLSTILVTNNLVNIGMVITSYYVTRQVLTFSDFKLGISIPPFVTPVIPGYVLEFIWNVAIVTFILVLFGEATPKVYATHNKLKIVRAVSPLFTLLLKVLYPLNYVLIESTRLLEKRLKKYNVEMDIEEINKAIEITVEKKESKQDAKLLKGIVHFGNIAVKQAMRQRTETIAADYDFNFHELLRFVKENNFSRYPVYKTSSDNIVGVLHAKDLIEHQNQGEDFGWQKLLREPFFVPETKRIDDLMREIQQNRNHLAVVVDEFGGVSGIITLEDIVEEVVGDISDEFDDTAETDFKRIDSRTFLFDGKTTITDACHLMEKDSDIFNEIKGSAETLGGLMLEIAGRIPKNGEEFKFRTYKFMIISVNNNRVEKIRIKNEI